MEGLMRIITLGTFDILHHGHLALLKFCKGLAGEDNFIVGLNSDFFVKQFKGKKPTMSFEERRKTLRLLPWVDEVVMNFQPEENAGRTIVNSGAKLAVIGMDWLRKDILKQWGVTSEWLDDLGISVCFFPFYNSKGISSSIIKERVRKSA